MRSSGKTKENPVQTFLASNYIFTLMVFPEFDVA